MAAVVAALLALAVATAPAAAASPVSDKQAEAARIERQLETLGERISVLDEQYNQAQLRAETAEAALADNQMTAAAAAQQAQAAREQLGRMAVTSYLHSGSASLIGMLLRGNPTDLSRRRHYVHAALDQQHQAVSDMEAAQQTLVAAQSQLDADRRAARNAAAAAAGHRRDAETTIAVQQSTLSKVDAELAGLIAGESQRREEEAAHKALAAQQAVAATAATAVSTTSTTVGGTTAAALATTTTTGTPTTTTTTALGSKASSLLVATTTTTPAASGPTLTNRPVSAGAAAAVEEARRQLGKPYVFGGAGPDSFDCSGLTMWAWRAGGRTLPHSATAQYNAVAHVATADRQPGDLLFFGSDLHHVGIYVGNDQMIEAPHTGAVVRYTTIWRPDLVGVGRP